ncbi:MAG: M60 family metallopeptidase, partial [Myxococcota bacterium]|nr:M60 family metallopeptidase [Myxococcota bacterium]
MKRQLVIFLLWPALAAAQNASVSGPALVVTSVDTGVVLSDDTFDAPVVLGDGLINFALVCERGTVRLASTAGLQFVEGGGGDHARIVGLGSADDINRALDGLLVQPPLDFAGVFSVTVTADGNTHTWQVFVNRSIDVDVARSTILDGVQRIHSGVQPGFMVAFGQEAYPIAFYSEGPSNGPVISAAGFGNGRVIAVPDHQMLNMDAYGDDSGRFYQNGIRWLAGAGQAVSIVTLSDGVGRWLTEQGYTNVRRATSQTLANDLATADVFIPPWLGLQQPTRVLEAITAFVLRGGGLFIAEYGAGYDFWWDRPQFQALGNRLLRPAGLGFVKEIKYVNGVLDIVAAHGQVSVDTTVAMFDAPEQFDAETLSRGGVLLGRIYDALPPDDPIAYRLDLAFERGIADIRPTPATPVTSSWDKAMLRREYTKLQALPPNEITAHRVADAVYGGIPDNAPRVGRVVNIDPTVTRWHATGMYAAPGEVVTLSVPNRVIDAGMRLRIGGHTDDIGVRDSWSRPPKVHWHYAIDAPQIQAASPFGGALYIDVGTSNQGVEPFAALIDDAVEAPYFVLGETSDDAWNETIRNAPAPYAELVSEHVAISLPSAYIRDLDNPTALMTMWNDVVRLQDELGTHGDRRAMPERINIDAQVSYGYLHAGYPTQGPFVSGPELSRLETLSTVGSWGWFHELGHEAQRRPDKSWNWDNAYTFNGSVEATVNIFTVYAYDKLNLRDDGGWRWVSAANTVMEKALSGLATGGYVDVDVGVKLAFFLQLRDHFGWPVIQEVFGRYNAEMVDLPMGEQAERDTWFIWVSQVTGHNMARFFVDVWGLEISPQALAQVADLPDWLPAVGGLAGTYRTVPDAPLAFDLAAAVLAHDGVGQIVDVEPPQHGQLVEVQGVWTYTAPADYLGQDRFSYGVRSSTGHVHRTTVDLEVSNRGVWQALWKNVPGQTLDDLRRQPSFPDEPDETNILSTMESPANMMETYGVRLRTYLIPDEDGEYTFWIASDDEGELSLATNRDWVNLQRIARVEGWTPFRAWTQSPTQRSGPIRLEANGVYAMEALMKEGRGGDHLSIAWARDDGSPALIPPELLYVEAPPPEPEPMDAGMPDASVEDSGVPDANVPDALIDDAGIADADLVDADLVDAGLVDAGLVDAGLVDAGLVDAGLV